METEARGHRPASGSIDAKLPAARARSDTVHQVYNAVTGSRIVLDGLYGMMNALLSGNFVQECARAGRCVQDGGAAAPPAPVHRPDDGMRKAMGCCVHAFPH